MKIILILLALAATTLGTARAQHAGSAMGNMSKPSAGPESATTTGRQAARTAGSKVVVSSGGQGHNAGPDPKGKTLVAPSAFPPKTGQHLAKTPLGKQ